MSEVRRFAVTFAFTIDRDSDFGLAAEEDKVKTFSMALIESLHRYMEKHGTDTVPGIRMLGGTAQTELDDNDPIEPEHRVLFRNLTGDLARVRELADEYLKSIQGRGGLDDMDEQAREQWRADRAAVDRLMELPIQLTEDRDDDAE